MYKIVCWFGLEIASFCNLQIKPGLFCPESWPDIIQLKPVALISVQTLFLSAQCRNNALTDTHFHASSFLGYLLLASIDVIPGCWNNVIELL